MSLTVADISTRPILLTISSASPELTHRLICVSKLRATQTSSGPAHKVKFFQYDFGGLWQNRLETHNMKNRTLLLLAVCFGLDLSLIAAEPQPTLNPHLEPLRPLLGKTWKGVFDGSTAEKPTVDIARWERVLNGQAVRLLHSINQGVYGG